jgi:hypothetical protein
MDDYAAIHLAKLCNMGQIFSSVLAHTLTNQIATE